MLPRTLSPRGRRTVTSLRLAALGIARPSADEPGAVVRSLLAVQAQDFPGALWSIGLRTRGATEASVLAAHASGAIVRSWPMRGTLHFLAGDDLGWMLSLTSERQERSAAPRHRELGLDADTLARARASTTARLSGGERATRAELLAEFVAAGLPVDGQRGVHLLGHLARTGLLVQCGRDEYALLAEHVSTPRELDPDAALRELALRYFLGHGPATERDLAWWAGLPLTPLRAAIAEVREQLDELHVDGVTHYLRPGLEPAPSSVVAALPGFDEYLLGYTDRSAALAPEHAGVIVPGGNGMFLPTIVARGEVVGTWRRDRTRAALRVDPQPFAPLSAATERGFAAATRRYARYLALPLTA